MCLLPWLGRCVVLLLAVVAWRSETARALAQRELAAKEHQLERAAREREEAAAEGGIKLQEARAPHTLST